MESIGIVNMMNELRVLNPTVKFELHDYSVYPVFAIMGTAPATELNFPEGYYWNEKNGITNKHNTGSGIYESFIYKYDPDYFVEKDSHTNARDKPAKKSFFVRLFRHHKPT